MHAIMFFATYATISRWWCERLSVVMRMCVCVCVCVFVWLCPFLCVRRALSSFLAPIHFRLSPLPRAPPVAQVEFWKNDKSGDPACLMCRKTIRLTRKITVQSLFAPATLDIFKKAASKQESALAAERARQAELAPSGTVGKEWMAASVSTADLNTCVRMSLIRH